MKDLALKTFHNIFLTIFKTTERYCKISFMSIVDTWIPYYKECKSFSRQSSRKNLNICDESIVLNE